MHYPTVDFNQINYSEASKLLKEYGVLVIENVFDADTCNNYMHETVRCFESLGTGVDRHKLKQTWIPANLPPQTRQGMFQAVISGAKPVWEMRNSEKLKTMFQKMYYHVRLGAHNETRIDEDMVCSIDGINFQPSELSKLRRGWPANWVQNEIDPDDWAHCDQTTPRDDPFKCIQGSLCLSETTAGFRCSPKSHLAFTDI